MSEIIRHIFWSMHGTFVIKRDYVDQDLKDFQKEIFEEFEIGEISNDRFNMRGDIENLKRDIKKAVKAYKEEITADGKTSEID